MNNYRFGLLAIVCGIGAFCVVACTTAGSAIATAKDFYELGILYESQKDLPRAIEMYTKAINIDPTLRAARYNVAHAQILQGNFESARTGLEAMHLEDPKNQAVLETLAYLEARQGHFELAWEHYTAVLAATEGRESVLFNLVLIGKSLGKNVEAWEYALRLVVIKPTEPLYQKTVALLGLELKKEVDSEPHIVSYLLAKEKEPTALLEFAEDLAAIGYHARALAILDGIVAGDAKNSRALFIQARELVTGAKDMPNGKVALKKALEAGFTVNALLQILIQLIPVDQQAGFLEIIKKQLPDFKIEAKSANPSTKDTGALQAPISR